MKDRERYQFHKQVLRSLSDPARDLRWNICHITKPDVKENHNNFLKISFWEFLAL